MVGSSKILTVSYGTFSCTLEGFDDPFSTMRSIAEYFRDLAADDRYFGAEPPTPDAEMLHRIAEREVQRRVEARISDDSIVLRQMGEAATAKAPAAAAQDETADDDTATVEETAPAAAQPAAAPQPHAPVESIYAEVEEQADADTEEPFLYAEDEEAAATAAELTDANGAAGDLPDEGDDSVAAKLSRIRAVVSGHAEAAHPARAAHPFAGSIQSAFEDTAAIEDADFEEIGDAATDEAAPVEIAAEAEAESADVTVAEEEAEAEIHAEDISLAARIVNLKRTTAPATEAEPPVAAPESSLSESDEAELARELAEAERADAELAAAEAADNAAQEEEDVEAADLDGEDEKFADAYRSWVADAEEEGSEAASETDDEPAGWEEADSAHPMSRHPGFDTAKTEDAAFDRILEQTNSRMDDSEGSRRRSAIAHLKAAVAATKADRLLKRTRPEDEAAEEQSQYRDDLAKVVQPRRPVTQPRDTAETEGVSKESAPAPLVLVSELRVDAATPQDEGKAYGDVAEDEAGFADFAAKMGATELPDLLEAAAAYTAFVEGNKLFSRPDLMRRVAHMDPSEEFTREAGLRSFGQLLRQGKIQKLKRGQFTISEETRFNPQARLAGE